MGPSGSKGIPKGSQGVKGWAYRVPGVQGVGLQGPRGSMGRPTWPGSQGGGLRCPIGATATIDGYSDRF